MLSLNRFSEPDKRPPDGCLKAQTKFSLFISWATTLAGTESPLPETPREPPLLETGALVLLPQLPSPSLFSLLEFSSLAAQAVSLCRSPPLLLRSYRPS